MTDLLQAKLKWLKQYRSDSLQETSIYLDYIVNPAKASLGNFIHAISDPFSYIGSLNVFDIAVTDYYINSQVLREDLIFSVLNNSLSTKFIDVIDTNNILA